MDFSHLKLDPCTKCKCVCAATRIYGVDCKGLIRMPTHVCIDCKTQPNNRVCPNYYTYGFDCSGSHPGSAKIPSNNAHRTYR